MRATSSLSAVVSILLTAHCALTVIAEELDWTILGSEQAIVLTRQCSRPFPAGLSGTWEPTASEVARAERELPKAVDTALSTISKSYRSHPQYHRQYAGFLRGDTRVLYVNAVDRDISKTWRDPVVICDGGTSSFGAVFDLQTESFDSFEFNGDIYGRIPRVSP